MDMATPDQVTPDMVGDRLDQAFDAFDSNRDGYLEWSDYQNVVDRCVAASGLGQQDRRAHALRAFYQMYWQELLRHAGTDDDRLSKAEFVVANRNACLDTSRLNVVDGSGHAVFDVIDADGDDRITKEQFGHFLRDVLRAETPEAMAAFAVLDADGDGAISREEFLLALREYSYSNDPDATGGTVFGRM